MQNKANLPDTEMSANFFDKRDYENKSAFAVQKNKAKSKPISNAETPCPACRTRDCRISSWLHGPAWYACLGYICPGDGHLAGVEAEIPQDRNHHSRYYYSLVNDIPILGGAHPIRALFCLTISRRRGSSGCLHPSSSPAQPLQSRKNGRLAMTKNLVLASCAHQG